MEDPLGLWSSQFEDGWQVSPDKGKMEDRTKLKPGSWLPGKSGVAVEYEALSRGGGIPCCQYEVGASGIYSLHQYPPRENSTLA